MVISPGRKRHADRAGGGFRVDQRVQHDLVDAGRRALDPEGAEERELLAAGLGRAQGEGAGDDPEVLAAGERPEEGRALDDGELGELAVAVGRVEPEAGEADVADGRGHVQAPELEAAAVVGDAAHEPVLDREERHRRVEDEAAMERLDGEAAVLAGPDGRVGQGLDADVLLVGQVREHVRQVARRRDVGPPRQHAGDVRHHAGLEALALAERALDDGLGRDVLRRGGRRTAKRRAPRRRAGPARRAAAAAEGRSPVWTGTETHAFLGRNAAARFWIARRARLCTTSGRSTQASRTRRGTPLFGPACPVC